MTLATAKRRYTLAARVHIHGTATTHPGCTGNGPAPMTCIQGAAYNLALVAAIR